jgi:tetratricopeptide (TPR) repeat protein
MFKKLFGGSGEKPLAKTDYSFGLPVSIAIKKHLDKKEYDKVEELMMSLDSDTISHVVDHLSLNTTETDIRKWFDTKTESEAACLVLGVFYAHKGWEARGHGYGSEVSEDEAMSFFDYEQKAEGYLKSVSKNKLYKAEAYCRLIRVYMALNDGEKEAESFTKCVALDPLKVWAYVHYLEAIEPKWGGSKEHVIELLENLPDSQLISHIMILKMLNDSFVSEEYLCSDEDIDILETARVNMRRIDEELTASYEKSSILQYMVYNYIVGLAQETGDKDLLNKYFTKMNNHYTLYPFGLQK